MQRCDELVHLYGAYIYGDTTADEELKIREHLEQCDKCRIDVDSQKKVVNAIPNALPKLSPGDRMDLIWSVRAGMNRQQKRTWWQVAMPVMRTASAAATVLVVFSAGTFFGMHLKGRQVNTETPPARGGQTVVRTTEPREQSIPQSERVPHIYQSDPATAIDPFTRSVDDSGTSRSGWNWRYGWPGEGWQTSEQEALGQNQPEEPEQSKEKKENTAKSAVTASGDDAEPATVEFVWPPRSSDTGDEKTASETDSSTSPKTAGSNQPSLPRENADSNPGR